MVAEHPRKIGVTETFAGKDGHGISYTAKVRVTVGEIVREGVGAGHGIDVDLGLAHESAIKEAETDAMKRALMTFGNPFGLALYDKSQENVSHGPTMSERAELAEKKIVAAKTDVELTQIWRGLDDDLKPIFRERIAKLGETLKKKVAA